MDWNEFNRILVANSEAKSASENRRAHCVHVYEYMHSAICPKCGADTHEPAWHLIQVQHRIWKELNPNYVYTWWSI